MSYQNLKYLSPWDVLDSITKSDIKEKKVVYHRNILSDEDRDLILIEKSKGLNQKQIFEKHGKSVQGITPHNIHKAFKDSK